MDQTSTILFPINGEIIKAKFIPRTKSASLNKLLNFLLIFPFVSGLYMAYKLAPLVASWPTIDWSTLEELIFSIIILIVFLLLRNAIPSNEFFLFFILQIIAIYFNGFREGIYYRRTRHCF